MAFFWQAASFPKTGNTPKQNEDAYRLELLPAEFGDTLLIALADGATEAVYSGAWARALVAAAGADWTMADGVGLNERVEPARRGFAPMTAGQEAPWYVRNKFLSQGSQATLLVASVSPAAEAGAFNVRAITVGDCCLLLFQAGGKVRPFPVQASSDFGVTPVLVRNGPQPTLKAERWEAGIGAGDFLVACSDAMAKWVLECLESLQAGLVFEALLALIATDPSSSSDREGELGQPEPTTAESAAEAPSLLGRLQELVGLFRPVQPKLLPIEPIPPGERQTSSDEMERPSFQSIVEHYRMHGRQPTLRDDDTTLVLCVPVISAQSNLTRQALGIIHQHMTAAKTRPPVIVKATIGENNKPFHPGEFEA